ncbi:MAG: glycerate kinase [Planctomycetes bacterium]|nr:glycerate kinase [Planctomycetota bacterium]
MKVIVALSAFKESISAIDAVNAFASGIKKAYPDARIIKLPTADGGDGTLETLLNVTKGYTVTKKVTGPLGNKVTARIGFSHDNKTAIIEMAQASGLKLISPCQRNPLIAHTYGTGELIKYALDKGARKIIIGIGGSATVDGGAGMAKALGYRFLNKNGGEIGLGGGALNKLHCIDNSGKDKRLDNVKIMVACDVANPLLGTKGAALTYAPQKGATPRMTRILENNLARLGKIVRRDLGIEIKRIKGGGAAGGLGAGLYAFCNAELKPGAEFILDTIGFHKHLKGTDLVIVGEGRFDKTSLYGKSPAVISKIAKKHHIPVIAVCGTCDLLRKELSRLGIRECFQLVDSTKSLGDSIRNARKYLRQTAGESIKFVS